MHWSFCQQDENCIALNYRIAHFFGVGRWPYRYKDLQEKRELPGKVYVYIYTLAMRIIFTYQISQAANNSSIGSLFHT